MPFKSKQQAKLMFGAANGSIKGVVPQKVARDFVANSHGMKVRALPERVTPKRTSSGMRGSSR